MIMTAFISASLSLFIEHCFESGQIFRRYYLFLTMLWMRNWRKGWKRKLRELLKPLGLCAYCFSTWICLGTALIYSKFDLLTAMYCCGINYLFIETWKLLEGVAKKVGEDAK